MTKTKQYRVVRRHLGDRMYEVGDTREARDDDVKHLVGTVLEEIGDAPAEKADDEPLNKAEPAAPANKVASTRKSKGK